MIRPIAVLSENCYGRLPHQPQNHHGTRSCHHEVHGRPRPGRGRLSPGGVRGPAGTGGDPSVSARTGRAEARGPRLPRPVPPPRGPSLCWPATIRRITKGELAGSARIASVHPPSSESRLVSFDHGVGKPPNECRSIQMMVARGANAAGRH